MKIDELGEWTFYKRLRLSHTRVQMSDNIKTGMNDNLSTVIEGVSQKRENLLLKSNFPQWNIMDAY